MTNLGTSPAETLTDAEPVGSLPAGGRVQTLLRRVRPHAYWSVPTAFAAVVLSLGLGRSTFSWDESATWTVAERSVPDIVAMLQVKDAVIVPYYLLMHGWIRLFGDSEAALRLPSLLCAVAAVGLTAELGRRLFDRRTGAVGAFLLAVIPGTTLYAQTARVYGIVLFLGVLATLLLLRALDRPRPGRWACYGAVLALLGLGHLLSLILLLAAHFLLVLERWWAGRERRLLLWLPAAALSAVPALPFMYLGMKQQSTQLAWVATPTWRNFLPENTEWLFLDSTVLAALIGLALAAGWTARGPVRRTAVLTVVPHAVLVCLGLFTTLWVPRYAIYTLAFLALLCASAVSRITVRAALAVVVIGVMGLGTQLHLREVTGHNMPDYRRLAADMDTRSHAHDAIAYSQSRRWALEPGIRHAWSGHRYPREVLVTRTPTQTRDLEPTYCSDAAACLKGVKRLWVVNMDSSDPLHDFGFAEKTIRHEFKVRTVWKEPGQRGVVALLVRR